MVTIIDKTASEAHVAYEPAGSLDSVVMPGDPKAFESRIRTLAENLAMDYGQECVAFALIPCHFELTTRQASYKRDTSRADQTAELYNVDVHQ